MTLLRSLTYPIRAWAWRLVRGLLRGVGLVVLALAVFPVAAASADSGGSLSDGACGTQPGMSGSPAWLPVPGGIDTSLGGTLTVELTAPWVPPGAADTLSSSIEGQAAMTSYTGLYFGYGQGPAVFAEVLAAGAFGRVWVTAYYYDLGDQRCASGVNAPLGTWSWVGPSPTAAPPTAAPTAGSVVDIASFTGGALDEVRLQTFVLGMGFVVVSVLLGGVLVVAGLRR